MSNSQPDPNAPESGELTREEMVVAWSLFGNAADPAEQERARQILKGADPDYDKVLLNAYRYYPFLRLTEDEVATLQRRVRRQPLGHLIALRDAATRDPPPRYVVFCMPKSGSSFIKSALEAALQLPFVSLTSFGTPRSSSAFGMNAREQELDELAIIKEATVRSDGFVAQHHTRYTQYLGLQMQLYGLKPIVTMRNVLDCIASFDDMILQAKEIANDWTWDPQFVIPYDYKDLDTETRCAILAPAYGVWLINFYLSWKRSRQHPFVAPLFVRYEEQVLQPEALIASLSAFCAMTPEQAERLRAYVERPDMTQSRFNVGRKGRGAERVPERQQAFLADYAAMFRGELTDEEIRYLVR
jgi:hypothetical protein